MGRHADHAGTVGDAPGHGLADPPRRVRREPEPAAILEAIHRLDQADVAFLEQIEQGDPASPISLRHRDDESKIRLDELPLGLTDYAVLLVDRGHDLSERFASDPDLLLQLSERFGAFAAG